MLCSALQCSEVLWSAQTAELTKLFQFLKTQTAECVRVSGLDANYMCKKSASEKTPPNIAGCLQKANTSFDLALLYSD